MKKLLILALMVSILTAFSCGKKTESPQTSHNNNTNQKVGLVFDVGGRGDKSFNDAAYKGLERAKKDFVIDFEVIDTDARTPCVLLVNDHYDPNWTVIVDGKEQPLLRANYVMRGVYLDPGKHQVEFK